MKTKENRGILNISKESNSVGEFRIYSNPTGD